MSTLVQELEARIAARQPATLKQSVGVIREIGDGVARVEGLYDVMLNEMLDLGHGVTSLALSLEETDVGVIILGDDTPLEEGGEVRATGKTTICVDTVINQARLNSDADARGDVDYRRLYSIYVAIGQKQSTIAQLISVLQDAGAMPYTIVVAAPAADSATSQYLAPFAGAAFGEWFMQHGMDALIVYDDLSKQAVTHRQVSLVLKRPSGREAYPGDVFYLRSHLLERAARVGEKSGDGSLTALPIIETQAGDVSAYIPTNVIFHHRRPDRFYMKRGINEVIGEDN
jgi:F0F1-type ATP synthase alpha subunit